LAHADIHDATGCRLLLVLRLNSCGAITDSACTAVAASLRQLRELDIKHAALTDAGLAALCAPQRGEPLQVLSVAHCRNMTPKGKPQSPEPHAFLTCKCGTLITLLVLSC
jgi:hypothetical protein